MSPGIPERYVFVLPNPHAPPAKSGRGILARDFGASMQGIIPLSLHEKVASFHISFAEPSGSRSSKVPIAMTVREDLLRYRSMSIVGAIWLGFAILVFSSRLIIQPPRPKGHPSLLKEGNVWLVILAL